MPPRRPLPDLVLISVFKALTPNDQLKAAEMSPRCAILVRAANRPVKTLVITSLEYFYGEETKDSLNCISLASEPVMQLLPVGGEPFPDYPMTNHLSKWNCLLVSKKQLFDQATVRQIVNAFSAVTDLKVNFMFINFCRENLIALLECPQWANQLTSLVVYYWIADQPTIQRLIAAINALVALQCLAVVCLGRADLPDMTIVAQLKVFAIQVYENHDHFWAAFLLSLEHYALSNVNLQLYLFGNCSTLKPSILTLGEPFRTRIVSLGWRALDWTDDDDVPRVCRQLPSLTRLYVVCDETSQLEPLFTALSALQQLVHLRLELKWTGSEEEIQLTEQLPQPFPRPMAQLTTVRALTLELRIHSHTQVQLLNLPVTLPRLQAIHIEWFCCESCDVSLYDYLRGEYSENSKPKASTALDCLRASLPLLHPGVPHSRIILGYARPYTTLEQLLYTSE